MVYLICFTCDATLKKPQLIKHMQGRCAYGNYSCIGKLIYFHKN